jgi:hypothetical protein
MQTIHQLVRAHISRSAALVNDPIAFTQESERMIGRIAERLRKDPSIELYAQHMPGALRESLRTAPQGVHFTLIHSLILQSLIEWEDINIFFDKSLAP